MAENDKFETLGDAYAKYPQSTLVMRKQYVDELNARIAQLEDDNALLKRNNENLRIDKKEIEKEAIERISEAEELGCEEYHVRADDILCDVLEKLGFKACGTLQQRIKVVRINEQTVYKSRSVQ